MASTIYKASSPQLVVFDLYGTLVQFGVMYHPFRELLKWARAQGRQPKADDARQIMTINADLFQLASHLGIDAPDALLARLQGDIEEELASLTLFDDVLPTLTHLRTLGVPVAICSNLAKPYGVVNEKLLSQFPLLTCLSYEVGFIKPDPEIYQTIVAKSGISPEACLFVGDTYVADYEGPIQNGFQARHLVRDSKTENNAIESLAEILVLFK